MNLGPINCVRAAVTTYTTQASVVATLKVFKVQPAGFVHGRLGWQLPCPATGRLPGWPSCITFQLVDMRRHSRSIHFLNFILLSNHVLMLLRFLMARDLGCSSQLCHILRNRTYADLACCLRS